MSEEMWKGMAAMAMSKEEIHAFLSAPRLARMATIQGGRPHIVPVWYFYDGENILVTTPKGTKKIRNLQENPNVAIIVDVVEGKPGDISFYTDAKCVIIEGKAELKEDNDFARKVYERYAGREALNNPMVQFTMNMPRYTLVIKPTKIISWDFTKMRSMQH